jgi:hypothetical protein
LSTFLTLLCRYSFTDARLAILAQEKELPPSLGVFCGDEGGDEEESGQKGSSRLRVCLKPSDAYVVTVQLDPQVRVNAP